MITQKVHAAKLKTGEDVVVKVQRPGIDASLKADLSFVYVASRVLEFFQPDFERTSLSAIAGDIRGSMLEELDFTKEARNVEEFRDFLAQNQLTGQVTAPKVYSTYNHTAKRENLTCSSSPPKATLRQKRFLQWNTFVV